MQSNKAEVVKYPSVEIPDENNANKPPPTLTFRSAESSEKRKLVEMFNPYPTDPACPVPGYLGHLSPHNEQDGKHRDIIASVNTKGNTSADSS
jgi:hypothetical protein